MKPDMVTIGSMRCAWHVEDDRPLINPLARAVRYNPNQGLQEAERVYVQ